MIFFPVKYYFRYFPNNESELRSKLCNKDSPERMRGERSGGRFDAPGEVMAD